MCVHHNVYVLCMVYTVNMLDWSYAVGGWSFTQTVAMLCGVCRTCLRCLRPLTDFFTSLNNPKFSASVDVYAPMFFCDLVTFLIVVFGYDKFGPSVSLLTVCFWSTNFYAKLISELRRAMVLLPWQCHWWIDFLFGKYSFIVLLIYLFISIQHLAQIACMTFEQQTVWEYTGRMANTGL